MQNRFKLASISLLITASIQSMAGGIIPSPKAFEIQLPNPAPTLSGFALGAGASINLVETTTQPDNFVPFAPVTSQKISPIFSVEWWSQPLKNHTAHQVFWGAELIYEYLSANKESLLSISDTSSVDDLKQNISSKISLLANLTFQLTSSVYLYLGTGMAVYPNVNSSVNESLNGKAGNETLYGGVAQVGALFHLSKYWYLNLTFLHTQTANQTFHQPNLTNTFQLSSNQVALMAYFHFPSQ